MAAKYLSDLDRLEDVFQDEICKKISSIVDFKTFARSKNGLCLDEPDIQRIVDDNPASVEEQKMKMLQLWKEKNGTKANAASIRSIVKTFHEPDLKKDYVRLSQDCSLDIRNPISSRSRVYRGEQRMLTGTRQVAVKLAPLHERNIREADHLSKLAHHPNVVSLIQSGVFKESTMSSYIYLVMEHCRRENLEDFIKSNKKLGLSLPEPIKLTMSKQFLQGLAFIHSKDIIHRDLKPSNVLISESGEHIKICDYGLSKSLSEGRSATNLSVVRVGTDGYRAQETYQKDMVSKESDIFSSGLVVYFVQSEGDHAYGKDPDKWNSNIKQNKNRDLSRVRKKKPLKKLLCKMLEHEPKNRPTAEKVLKNVIFVGVSTELHLEVFLQPDISLQLDDSLHLMEKANAIVMWDHNSEHLLSFFPKTKQWNRMQKMNRNLSLYTLLVFEDHIHALNRKSMHRLKYSDPTAELTELQETNEDHSACPPAVALNDSLYVCGGGIWPPTRSVEKYKAGQWQGVAALNVARRRTCAVVAKDCLYCIGGDDEQGNGLRSVEKFDEESNQWSEVEPTPRPTWLASAVEKDGILHVADKAGIQCMDIQKESWKIMKPDHWPSDVCRAHINIVSDELYVAFDLNPTGVEIYHLDERTEKMTLLCKRDDIDMYGTNSIALKL